MGIIVLFVLLLLLAVGLWIGGRALHKSAANTSGIDAEDRRNWGIGLKVSGLVVAGLMGLLFLADSINSVSTKNIGVVTAFGATEGHLSNGLHLLWPWQDVTELDAAVQTDSFKGGNCINVRIAHQQTACVDVTIRWRIRPAAADSLFQDYHTFDNVRDSLVIKELDAAVNTQFANYNPFASLETTGTLPDSNNMIAADVTGQMQREIGSRIDVLNTIVPFVGYDTQTQARLNQLQQQIAATLIATQEQKTNQAQAIANKDLAASVDTSPNVLVAQCLNTLNLMVKNGQNVPAGFSCWPGGGVAGVIANATTGK